MTDTIDFTAQARLVSRLAARTADGQLGAPTPCEDYAVRHLLGHLVGLSAAFRHTARKDLGPMTSVPPNASVPDVAPGWRDELDRNLDAMAGAWQDPAAWEGETQAGGVTLPAALAGRFALNELVLHGWDLARATGQEYVPDATGLAASYALLAPMAESTERVPVFGPPVTVAADAPLLDQVVALSGRRPDWAPPGA
ncbi:TIGR03086 family metal-binding protein [Streptomyces angustmyceticus]|uniref:TIGR03086 family metal-binding protein n=1 Tax=Streptomyces angustmyceticus TaxID=285578 RepID=UPI0021AF8C92|nr:TIGR03086 family metal-binding protein [Streptomyces angustmyceticus]